MGFSIPLSVWLRSDLREWVENQIGRIPQDSEHFNKPQIEQLWREHLAGQIHTEQLWGVLSLLAFVNP